MDINRELFNLQDKGYREFNSKLVPNVDKEYIIGVRIPVLRNFAKEHKNSEEFSAFLQELPHRYYDENILHGILLSEIPDYEECIRQLDIFLPYVDNWAVCDIISPKIFKKNKTFLIGKIYEWTSRDEIYICRFGIEMLMSHFLDSDYKREYLYIPANICSKEYYLNMMLAWFFATALAKQWDDTIVFFKEQRLDSWVHNKAIQKAIESRRISFEQKEYLRGLKV